MSILYIIFWLNLVVPDIKDIYVSLYKTVDKVNKINYGFLLIRINLETPDNKS